ncbi:TIGR03619 family F420-dependent LLM class oxidoreductase [Saccharopolyspora indica]|uniref:TIGR03619 family F420-dependent LLM class oxidoreductase n=1 Tax=Saccharopolyspora indica TaxID=1229659 RepID=UPI0022EB3942|nr:TIGR03619 family F420-dependent LLM class oxidoreductase [Saccharopolyspora indica]MDA3648801.1 TIGR03619 family F420-dependent LLM class oxidoreductase [Saccharopolyspora indica]
MRLGLTLPQFGPFSDPLLVPRLAAEAEALGFESLWAGERVHAAADPITPYPGGTMPEQFRSGLDPLLVLTLAAGATTRPLLGTSTLNAPLHPPIHLARSLAGIDQLSGGRLIAGFGLSWSRDEYDAVGVPWRERGARLDETLDVLAALWDPDPVQHSGKFWTISPGHFQPKPAKQVPIYLGGLSPVAFRRIGRRADGWLGVALPVEALRKAMADIDDQARRAGRGPIATAVRINVKQDPDAVGQLVDYLHELAGLGVADAFVDLQFSTATPAELLDRAARIRHGFQSSGSSA